MDDLALRAAIYQWFAEHGSAPGSDQLVSWLGDSGVVASSLERLHDAHALVLDGAGSIRMALPFSAVPTPYVVSGAEMSWMANCAWDALAIPAAMGTDVSIEAPWLDEPGSVELDVRGGQLSHDDGYVHFAVPTRRWWDDIVET